MLSREDNLSEMLYVFPDNSDSATMQLPGGSFTTTIDKATKAIKMHSIKVRPKRDPKRRNDAEYQAWLQQKEFTPFMDKVWLLLAKAEFQEANYLRSITTFLYITKIYGSQPEIVAESNLWIARAYTEMGWLYEAGNVLHKMELAGGPPEKHKALYAAVKANYLIRSNDYTASVPFLELAIKKEKDKHQKLRMKYLLGQIYSEMGDKVNADKAYAAVQGMSTPYNFSFNAKLNQLQLNASGNSQKTISSLNSLAGSSKNKDYLDQIYNSIGNIYLQNSDTAKAIDNYRKAIKESIRNGYDKAMAQVTLGDLYFNKREFVLAQPCYSEALPQLTKRHPDYPRVYLRSDVLDELVVHVKTVYEQDSLQHLAQLPEAERLQIINAKIEEEKKKEEERKKEEEQLQKQEDRQNRIQTWADLETSMHEQPNQPKVNVPTTNATGQQGQNAFYFYNEQAVNQGKIAFRRQWGARKLEDDWRRRDKSGIFSDFADTETDISIPTDSLLAVKGDSTNIGELQETKITEDIFSVDYYLQQLPLTEEAVEASNVLIENALFNMGLIYKNKLEDMGLAIDAFGTDIRRFPNTPNLEEIYYQLFLIYMHTGDQEMMASYRSKLLVEFPQGVYASALSQPDYEWNFKNMPLLQDSLYNEAFNAYQLADVQTVRKNYEEINKKYPLTDLMPQFTLLNALSYAQTRDAKDLTENLTKLVSKYPKSDVTPLAEDILTRIKEGKLLLSDGSPITGFDWGMAYIDSTQTGEGSKILAFSDSLDMEYLLLLMFKPNTVDRNELLFEVADYNFSNYVIQTYDLNFESNPLYDILQIKGFDKFSNVRSYLNKAFAEGGLIHKIDTSIMVVPIATDNYTRVLPRLGMEQYTAFFAEHFNEQLPQLIAYWNKDTDGIETYLAQVTEQKPAETGENKQPEDIKPEIKPETTGQTRIIPNEIPKREPQQRGNDKQITADDLLSKDQLQGIGKVDDAIKSADKAVEEIFNNPVDGIRGLFNKYKNREKLTKEEKAERKEEERQEKQRQKELKAVAKAKQDSINKIEKVYTDSVARAEKAVQDSIQAVEKQRKQQLKLEEQAKKDAEKAAIKAREDERKRKEEERNQREQQQKERQRQLEQERREKEKARENERKEKERLQNERQRQREKERDEKEKAREKERREKEKQAQERRKQ